MSALTWAVEVIGSKGRSYPCARCFVPGRAHLLCSRCPLAYCPSCLHIDRDAEWHLGWECPACAIECLVCLKPLSSNEVRLSALIDSVFEARGARLRPSTWRLYHRCVEHVISFSQTYGILVIPVLNPACAWGLAAFFAHLRHMGFSWGRICHYKSALRSLHLAGDFPDPFISFPLLSATLEGIKRLVGMHVNRKLGLTIDMLIAMLAFLKSSEDAYRAAGQTRNADVALRKQAILVLAFFFMKRGAECWLSRDGKMGLRRRHLTLFPGSHVRLDIQSMKNDVYGEGHTVDTCWVSGSGVQIGDILQWFLTRYDASVPPLTLLTPDTPLFLPVHPRGGFYHTPGAVSCFAPVVKDLLPLVFAELRDNPALLRRFSFHSLRRGGASWAYRQGVPLKLIMGHGIWRSKQGIAPYLIASMEQRLAVTRVM